MNKQFIILFHLTLFLCYLVALPLQARQKVAPPPHPNLLLTQAGVKEIANNVNRYEVLKNTFGKMQRDVDKALNAKMEVPVPKDAGGGATHNQHSKNYKMMYQAGVVYQVTKDPRYAQFVKDMLMQYAALYKTLPLHPAATNKTPGKLFWQSLNDCNWLVYSIQAYDCIYDFLGKKDVDKLNQELFLPMARFLSEESAYSFNRVHNHGTWAVAAVGMTGYVLGEPELVEKSLKGLGKDGKGGFLLQLDQLFSPDGYYTEGPYYQRYALLPFMLFASAINQNQPQYNIFAYRDSILTKATQAALQLTYNNKFFPFNDAIKTEDFTGDELVHAVNIVYGLTEDKTLLGVAQKQSRVIMSGGGVKVAAALSKGQMKTYGFRSLQFTDGASGDEGGIGVLRSGTGDKHTALTLKYSAHGLSHGHYDKLSLMLYDNGQEILQDYGAVRFVNNAAKNGGRYLPENDTWGKQTIAHNTVVVDEKSHFGGNMKLSEKSAPKLLVFAAEDPVVQIMGATSSEAYAGVTLKRLVVLLHDPAFAYPVTIDLFEVISQKQHQYDLPFYYLGALQKTSFGPLPTPENNHTVLGQGHGYQHLYLTGKANPPAGSAQVTWQNQDRRYTLSTVTTPGTEILFTQIGATDPNENLRKESSVILRQAGVANHTFVSALEPHTQSAQIKSIRLAGKSDEAAAVELELVNGTKKMLLLALEKVSVSPSVVEVDGMKTSFGKAFWYGKKGEIKDKL